MAPCGFALNKDLKTQKSLKTTRCLWISIKASRTKKLARSHLDWFFSSLFPSCVSVCESTTEKNVSSCCLAVVYTQKAQIKCYQRRWRQATTLLSIPICFHSLDRIVFYWQFRRLMECDETFLNRSIPSYCVGFVYSYRDAKEFSIARSASRRSLINQPGLSRDVWCINQEIGAFHEKLASHNRRRISLLSSFSSLAWKKTALQKANREEKFLGSLFTSAEHSCAIKKSFSFRYVV